MPTNKLTALINLLDDPDKEVYTAVTQQLMSKGEVVIPELEAVWETCSNEVMQQRIENVLRKIQLTTAKEGLVKWINGDKNDLLEGAFWVAKHQYPELNYNQLNLFVEKIKTGIWLEINEELTALEKIKIVNHFLYEIYMFGSEPNFMQPAYCFINHVIDTGKGNPITLSILYITICQRLNLPVYGLCIPRNFLAIYTDIVRNRALFYMNPFHRGMPLSETDIQLYFKQMKIKAKPDYFEPRENTTVILRLVESLVYIYEQEENEKKVNLYRKLIPLFGDDNTFFQDE